MKKRGAGIALAAALILTAFSVRLDVAYGAIGIDTEKEDCSITFNLSVNAQVPIEDKTQKPEEGEEPELAGFEELTGLPVDVDLYKIADTAVSGSYTEPKNGSRVLYDVLKAELDSVNAAVTAATWENMAKKAGEKVLEDTSISPIKSIRLNAPGPGEGNKAEDLSTGLYLVIAHDARSLEYLYKFTPYLVSVPGNHYQKPGDSDAWIYDVEVSLKPSRENLYGDLEIVKTLNSYNAALGGASFVFQIEAEKNGRKVFSDVVSIVFEEAGTKAVTLAERIPAGAEVTVTEIYSGSSYEVISDPEKTAVITAKTPQSPDAPDSASKPASVAFTNDYDERLNGGTSVENRFTYTEDAGSGTVSGSNSGTGQENGAQIPGGNWSVEQAGPLGNTGSETGGQ